MIDFIQLGANIGKSETDIMWIISEKFNWKGIYVEPHPEAFEQLTQYYSNTTGHFFENVAVVPSEYPKIVTLYCSPDVLAITTVALDHKRGMSIEKKVPATTLRELVEKYNMIDVEFELLQIDIEGLDAPVLLDTDFSDILPRIIRYESVHTNDKVQKQVIAHLDTFGYQKIEDPYYSHYSESHKLGAFPGERAEAKRYNTIFERKKVLTPGEE